MDQPVPVPGVDPSRVNTPAELAACLDGLRRRRNLSYGAMEKAARNLPPRRGGQRWESLGKSTVGEIVTGKRTPTKAKLLTFLAVCQVAPADLAQWLAAWERASTAHLDMPADVVRIRDARPRRLGVRAAIQVEGSPSDLPVYVPRDIDGDLRAALAAGAEQGCFVLLVGGSSVGKTRTLWETVLATVPDWWLLHPDRDHPERLQAMAAAPTPRTVVWLDEFQRYLGVDGGLTPGTVRTLLGAGMVLVGTMWPDEYAIRVAPRQPGGDDEHERDRELLDLAQVLDVAEDLTAAERARAQELAAIDGRIRAALDSSDGGLIQVLAAGPELVRWWEQASNPYAKAIITAAVDARRLGVDGPVTAAFLADAAPGYLTPAQCATAPGDWLQSALAYATRPLRGAASALNPVDDGTMGSIAGYIAADFLLQHGRRVRRTINPPDSAWHALSAHVSDIRDLERLAESAENRMLYRYSRPLVQQLADYGDSHAAIQIRIEQGDLDGAVVEAQQRANDGDLTAIDSLIWTLEDLGYVDAAVAQLRSRASQYSTVDLVGLLSRNGRLDELKVLADAGDEYAARRLAFHLARRGRADEALALLRPQADARPANGWVAARVADCLAVLGRLKDLQARADAGDEYAQLRLLARQGRLDELRAHAAAGNELAESLILTALIERGLVDEAMADLQRRVDEGFDGDGDIDPADELGVLLVSNNRIDELKAEVCAGNRCAGRRLVDVLTEQGQHEQADLLRRFGLNPDGTIATPPDC